MDSTKAKSEFVNGPLALAGCAFGWSLAGLFLKNVAVNSIAAAGMRSFFAFITIAVLSRRLPCFVIRDDTKEGSPIDKKATFYLWCAGVSYAATMILFCAANKLTYAANAVLLQYTHPIWIILVGPALLGEKNSRFDLITVAGVLVGMVLFFGESIFGQTSGEYAATQTLGNIIALISGVGFGLTTIFQRKQQADHSRDAFMISQLITAIFAIPFIFFAENGIPDSRSLIFLILLGCIQMGIPNVLYAKGIKYVRALSAALITMIEPLMNPIWVLIFVHEVPSLLSVAGGLLILGCILVREIAGSKSTIK